MLRRASLSTKLIRTGAALLVMALASIGLTLWVTWQLEGGAAAVNEAGRMRMQTWRLSSALLAQAPRDSQQALIGELDQSLRLLRSGDPGRPLFVPWNPNIRKQFERVERLWQEQKLGWEQGGSGIVTALSAMATQRAADAQVSAIDELVLAIEQQLSRHTAILNLFQFLMMALAIGGAAVMLYTGFLYVILPLDHLSQGLRRVESGEFSARIEVTSRDEFGQVAAGFNRMAQTLQSLYQGLESSVRVKTRHIEAQRARLEALYGVSAFLAEAGTLEEMCKGFCQRLRTLLKADAVAVRWADEGQQRFLLLASDGLPGDIAQAERSLAAGTCHCASPAPDTRTRVIPILDESRSVPCACSGAGFVSVVNVPLRLKQRLTGEVNLMFRHETALAEDEQDLLDALASHLANALEGLRAAALEREAAVSEERALLARELHDSIAQSLAFLKIQVQLLRTAVQKAQPDLINSSLDELDAGLRESIGDVRELLMHFRTRTNTGSIEQALQETTRKFQHQTGLPVHVSTHGDGLPLPADTQVQVLHVIQEALSNVRKHAQARQVTLEIQKGAQWRFTVRDDGTGFDSADARDESHVGLRIMHERAQRIGARVSVESVPGDGTSVTLVLPLHPMTAPLGDLPKALQAEPADTQAGLKS